MNRYSLIMANAATLRSTREAMNVHLRKSKACSHAHCTNSKCGFYHNRDDYKAPLCIYEEFCRNNYCTMFHPHNETRDQYITRMNVKFPQSDPRRDKVMADAQLLRTDKNAMIEHLKKSKVCTNSSCNQSSECPFAHSLDDFKPPTCIYYEFCGSETCKMFHPHRQTVDEYIIANNISFSPSSSSSPSSCAHVSRPYPDGAFTKMCNLMTHDEPCPREWCTYAHSIYDLHFPDEIVCYDYHEMKDECCLKFHPTQCKCCVHDAIGRQDGHVCKELLQFVTNLGYIIEPFMTRHPSDNRLSFVKIYKEQQKFIDEMKQLEESENINNIENIEINHPISSLSIAMSSLTVKSDDH